MSKARQIYYSAIFGAIGGLLAWLVIGSVATGRWGLTFANLFVGAGVGLFIGGMVGAVDGIMNKQALRPALSGSITGAIGGMVSGALGLLLGGAIFVVFGGGFLGRLLGWLLLGLLLGVSDGLVARSSLRITYSAIGGTLAGAIGGLLYEFMTQVLARQNPGGATQMDRGQMLLSALGLILIGACLGGIIPTTIALFAQGRLRVLTGRRAGTEIDVLDAATLGSYDGCELYLPGDKAIARKHARLHRDGNRFFVTALASASGTFVDGAPLTAGALQAINKGAKLQLGNTVVELL